MIYENIRFQITRYFMETVVAKRLKVKKGAYHQSSFKNSSDNNDCVLLHCARQNSHTNTMIIQPQPCNGETRTMYDVEKSSTKVITTCFLPPPLMMEAISHETALPVMTSTIYVKPLIILDLNGILCRRMRGDTRDPFHDRILPLPNITIGHETEETDRRNTKTSNRNLYRPSCAFVAGTPIISRTDLQQLLEYLNTYFTLAVWTSAKLKTAKLIVKELFPIDVSQRLLFIWGQNRCERKTNDKHNLESRIQEDIKDDVSNSSSNVHPKDTLFIKSLAKVWNEYPLWNSSNTLLIDDSPEKCPLVHIKNTIHPPPILGVDSSVLDPRFFQSTTSQLVTDEVNQERQRTFFQQLTELWIDHSSYTDSPSKVPNSSKLHDFLMKNGRGHMGYRG